MLISPHDTLVLFCETVLRAAGWPQFIAKDDLEFLGLLTLPPECWDLGCVPPSQYLKQNLKLNTLLYM